MPAVQTRKKLSSAELLGAADKLSTSELEKFVSQVITLQAKRRAPFLSETESELLLKINEGIPPALQNRYNQLIAKRRAEKLLPQEYKELLRLTNEIEKLEARRIAHLSALASIRKISLRQLMDDLGIYGPGYE